MDRETLENLIADQALGALPPEVEALLEAYLAEHPESRRKSAQVQAAVALARRSLQDPGGVAVPGFPARRLREAQWQLRAGRFLRLAVGAAACIAVGLVLGRGFPRVGASGNPVVTSSTTARAPQVAVVMPDSTVPAASAVPSFWTYSVRSPAKTPGQTQPVIWDSAVRLPNLKGPS